MSEQDRQNRLPRLLRCPACGGALEQDMFSAGEGDSLLEGMFSCKCGLWYPVVSAIPRMFLRGDLRPDDRPFLERWREKCGGRESLLSQDAARSGQSQVQRSFGYKWTSIKRSGTEDTFKGFLEEWLLPRYGWKGREEYRDYMSGRRVCLDAGCGLGRETIRMARANPDATVVGLELSECVDGARANAEGLDNAFFVQGDLTHPPFAPETFDFILSEGVLHHTPDTRRAFLALTPLLKRGGEIAFYVYSKKAPLREYADDFVRAGVADLEPEECCRQMESLTRLARALSDLKVKVEVPEDVPVLGIRAGRYDVQRFIYWNMFKCFWNDSLPFEINVMNNYDWYHPKYAWRHTPEEVRGWVKEAGLVMVHEHVERSGITVRASRNV